MKAWFEFLGRMEKRIGREAVQRWLSPLSIKSYDACNLYLEAENSFQIAFFKEHIDPILKTDFLNNNFRPIKVHLFLKGENFNPFQKTAGYKKKITSNDWYAQKEKFNFFSDDPNPTATFENFFPSPENELAFRLLLDLSGFNLQTKTFSPPQTFTPPFNPVFLHGPEATGKTHLLEALANILKRHKINFFYINTNTFTEHVVSAMRFGGIATFREKYRKIDALLIDDIHILANKNATQEEFFHTFNALHMAEKLIVLTSQFTPKNLKNIEDRLISRFQWGITLPLEKLNPSALISILNQKAKEYALKLTNETVSFLLKNFPSIKDLQKALQAIALRLEDKQSELSLEKAQNLLQDLLLEQSKKALTADLVIEKIAYQFGLRKEDILSKGQSKELSFPRQIAIYFLRQKLALTYQTIGSIFKRDHSTIITSFRNIKKIKEQKEEKNLALLSKIDTLLG